MRIIILSDSPHMPTGLAKVGRALSTGLRMHGHDMVYFAWFHHDSVPKEDFLGIPVFYAESKDFGASMIDRVVNTFQPECILTIGDIWNLWYLADPNTCKTRRYFQWMQYIPCDGEPIGGGVPPGLMPILEDADWPIAYTKYAETALRKSVKDEEFLTRLRTIYHGIDPAIYRPRDQDWRREARRKFGIRDDQFVFLTVARNQSRKCIPELFRAWKIFSEMPEAKGKVLLWPHMYFNDPAGWNIRHLIQVVELRNDSIIYYKNMANAPHEMALSPESEVETLYGIADAFVLISGEGFGLPTLEAMASGLPCILIDYAASSEIGAEGRAEMIPVKDFATWTGMHLTQRPMPDPERVAESMARVFKDSEYRRSIAEKGMVWASQQTWEKTVGEFNAVMMDIEIPFLRPRELEVIA